MKHSVNIFVILSMVCLLIATCSTQACAKSSNNSLVIQVSENTSEEISGTSINITDVVQYSVSSAYVTRQVTYSGKVTPPMEMAWTEQLNGSTYSGTLYLREYHYRDGETVAIYVGSLDKQ